MKSIMLLTIAFFMLILQANSADIYINEVSATSYKNYYDEDYDDSDWIELYNNSELPVNLKGYKIFDKNKIASAWELPDTIIAPKSYIVIFASDKNRYGSDKYEIKSYGYGILPFLQSDEFRYHYLELSGDFEISVRINSIFTKQFWAKAGLMIRESMDNGSRFSGVFCTPEVRNLVSVLQRDTINTYPQKFYFNPQDYPYNWIKIRRTKDSVFFLNKIDGYSWRVFWQLKNDFKEKLFVGIAASSADINNKDDVRVLLSELEINNKSFSFQDLTIKEVSTKRNGSSGFSKELHTNFKLGSSGETLFLWNNAGKLIDEFKFPAQTTNISYGRFPDGSGNLCFLKEISPGFPNKECYIDKSEQPAISLESGWYNNFIKVIITSKDINNKIYYTLNGDEPTVKSKLYDGVNILIDKTTVLKAKIIKPNYIDNLSVTRTYFINENFRLPVISIVTDSLDLWSDDYGIFLEKHIYSDREIPVYFDFFESKDKLSFSSSAGAKLHGGATQYEFPQKSLRFYSRNLYGNDVFKHKFWENQINNNVDKFIIKNGGQDWNSTFIRDAYTSCFINDFKNVLIMESRPVEAYINGQYWGAYILRDRFDEDFVGLKYNVEPTLVNYIEDETELKHGSSLDFFNHLNYIQTLNLTSDSSFDLAAKKIDIDNFSEYTIFRFFSGIWDWPGQNHKIWNSPEHDDKWRWVLTDFDLAFGNSDAVPEKNMFNQVKNNKSYYSGLLYKLLENINYRNLFINRFADYLNSTFKPEHTIPMLDSLADLFAPAVQSQQLRWKGSIPEWAKNIEIFKDFLNRRPQNIFQHIVKEFKLEGTEELKIKSNIADACYFKINSLKIDAQEWKGTYFKGIPVTVSCIPKDGYKFVKWISDSSIYNPDIEFNPGNNNNLQALMVKDGFVEDRVIINEIMYKASDLKDCKDWIELYNNGSEDIDISGWKLKDNDDDHFYEFVNGTIINSGKFLVIVEDSTKFREIYSDTIRIVGQLDFGYGRGDAVRLFDKFGNLLDSVTYDVVSPWDKNADGMGYSLELINPNFDNSLAENWKASLLEGGSPGRHNDIYIDEVDYDFCNDNEMLIYPNPANDYIELKLNYGLKSILQVNDEIKIYNSYGELIQSEKMSSSFQKIDVSNLQAGVYNLKINNGYKVNVMQLVLVR